MKFKINVIGISCDETNYMEVVNKIKKQYGLCPAIGDIVVAMAQAICLENAPAAITISKKEFDAAYYKATKMISYSPAYFIKKMKEMSLEELTEEDYY